MIKTKIIDGAEILTDENCVDVDIQVDSKNMYIFHSFGEGASIDNDSGIDLLEAGIKRFKELRK